MAEKKKHFVLVHGACLGAWIWYKVATQLKSTGHKVTAIDMAACGVHPKRSVDIHSNSDYAEPLMEFMAAQPPDERVILVGHSLGGVCTSLAMEKFPQKIAAAVFISAVMPCPGTSLDAVSKKYERSRDFFMDCKIEFDNGKDKPPTSIIFGPKYMSTKLFQLCSPEDITLASLLIRPTPSTVQERLLEGITKENYGSIPRIYLKPDQDNVINEGIEKFRLENYPPDEFRIINNSDHMPMLSNPQEICACLDEISQKYH